VLIGTSLDRVADVGLTAQKASGWWKAIASLESGPRVCLRKFAWGGGPTDVVGLS